MISVCTLVRGRTAQLANLLWGIAAQTRKPDELVIAYMQPQAPAGLPDPGVPVREVFVPGDPMPLAEARNAAAATARGERLIFLDVDCVPSPTLVERYDQALDTAPGVYLGEVRYLPPGPFDPAKGVRHPAKPALSDDETRPVPSHGELWGLSFALPRSAWDAAGGMDTGYVGYGGEETDFAWRLAAAGIPMAWVGGAVAFHQHHPVHIPPLHQFDAILRNATRFRARWGRWCMDYWLGQFAQAGLIRWSADSDTIDRLRAPTLAEIAASRREDALFS
ncbi:MULTISPECIES: glycosyltransferase family 2 protein [Sphingomonas]|uniref:glycosyltransferase family 2 protein n=1 Tax=Sphingomonas TaxID=13687 RepID=UPI000AC49012|nr:MULTISPECIES: galactosyltransferase-related protein [Sphingomonas]WCP72235.1 glycosyltransferase [Sphingomonas hankookensis]